MAKRSIPGILFLPVSLLAFTILLFHAPRTLATARSPQASTSLTCHISHASECYPAIFQPTRRFQRIHDDQTLPPGLHVRMNLATGLKEARLNVPLEEEDVDPGLIVVIDEQASPSTEEETPLHLRLGEQAQAHALQQPFYSPPRDPSVDPSDTSSFNTAVETVLNTAVPTNSSDSEIYLIALITMTDLSHSLEWGLALTKDTALSNHLLALISRLNITTPQIRSAATLLLATALQNNPLAFSALVEHFQNTSGPLTVVMRWLEAPELRGEDAVFQARLVLLLAQLCQDGRHIEHFVGERGLEYLRGLFDARGTVAGDGRDKVRGRIANFVADHAASFGDDENGLWVADLNLVKGMYQREKIRNQAMDAAYESIREARSALLAVS